MIKPTKLINELANTNKKFCIPEQNRFRLKNGVDGYTVRKKDNLTIYLNPSNEKIDWLTNFRFCPYNLSSKTKAHKGYSQSGEELYNLKLLKNGIENVTIFSYSNGGGVAQAFDNIYFQEGKMFTCYNFEAPAIFFKVSKSYQESLKGRIFNFVCGKDIVYYCGYLIGMSHKVEPIKLEGQKILFLNRFIEEHRQLSITRGLDSYGKN